MSEAKPTLIIKPTIGRRVWFRCNDSFAKEKGIYRIDDVQAMDAGIVYVHGDSMVNLIVTDHIGNTHAINSVALVDASDGNSHAMWCEWMPYQKEQAKSKCAVIEPATEQQIEQEIQSKNLNAPRLTPADIDSKIKAVEYILPRDVCKRDNGIEVFDAPLPLQTLTFCILTLENGFTVTGESACASPENFDAEIGRKIAFENAREKIWLLEGYLLKEKLNHRIKIQEYFASQGVDAEKLQDSPIVSELPELEIKYSDAVKSTDPTNDNQACASGSASSNGYQLNAKRDNAFLVAQLLSNNKISAELRKKAETKMTALLDELI